MYRQKLTYAGQKLDAEIYTTFPTSKNRGCKKKPSSEVQKLLNAKNAAKSLSRMIDANFTEQDIAIELNYADYYLPETDEQWHKDIDNYIRRVKALRKRKGLSDLKYIKILEKGTRTGRMHTHLILSGGILRDELEELWGKGRANAKRLQPDEYGYDALANYFYKPDKRIMQDYKRRVWAGSRNLVRPTVDVTDTQAGLPQHRRRLNRKLVEDIKSNIGYRKFFEDLYPGYRFADSEIIYNDVNGGIYISISMRQIMPARGKRRMTT